MTRVTAAAHRHAMLRAPAVIEARTGRTALEVLAALGTMALPVLTDLAALVAHRHADASTMSAGTLAAAAQITLRVIRCTPGLAGERVHARTMVGVSTGSIVAAEAAVAPEQTALAAGGVLAGIFAQISHIAAAHLRITEVLSRLFALLMLRFSDAVLAHHRSGMTLLAGEVAFNTTLGQTMLANAADVARIAAFRRTVILAVAGAMTALAADRRLMHVAIAVVVAPLTAISSAVIQAIAAHVTALAAISSLMLHTITGKMARLAAGCCSMTHAIAYAMILKAACSLSMIALAGKMAFSAAGSRNVLLAIAIEMAPHAACRMRVIHTVAVEMARDPTGLRTIVLLSIPLGVLRIAARRLAAIVCSQRTRRSTQQQAEHQQR